MALIMIHTINLVVAGVTYPTVWGGAAQIPAGGPAVFGCSGFLFAFSGLRGPTTEENAFVGINHLSCYRLIDTNV